MGGGGGGGGGREKNFKVIFFLILEVIAIPDLMKLIEKFLQTQSTTNDGELLNFYCTIIRN